MLKAGRGSTLIGVGLSPAADKSTSHDLSVSGHVKHREEGKGKEHALGHIEKLGGRCKGRVEGG